VDNTTAKNSLASIAAFSIAALENGESMLLEQLTFSIKGQLGPEFPVTIYAEDSQESVCEVSLDVRVVEKTSVDRWSIAGFINRSSLDPTQSAWFSEHVGETGDLLLFAGGFRLTCDEKWIGTVVFIYCM
jgi:hypothetical protein